MSIQKIFLVLKREYITRLRSKGFLIATLLIPLGMIAFIGVMVAITTWDTESQHRIGIADHTETIYPRLEETSPAKYRDLSNLSKDSLRSLVLSETRSEEHTSELQSRFDLVCRLLLEKT